MNTKSPFSTVYFLWVRGLKTSSYMVHDYTTCGHTDLYILYICVCVCVCVCVCIYIYIYTHTQYMYIYIQYIYLFLMQ